MVVSESERGERIFWGLNPKTDRRTLGSEARRRRGEVTANPRKCPAIYHERGSVKAEPYARFGVLK
jgi:hypothetical protein